MFFLWSMVFRCVPSRFLSCLCLRGWRFLCLAPGCLDVVRVFASPVSLSYFVRMSCGRSLTVLRILPTGSVSFLLCKYVGECLVCVMYVCRWL